MTMVSHFSCQNDTGLRTLNVVLWENLKGILVLTLEYKGLYFFSRDLLAATGLNRFLPSSREIDLTQSSTIVVNQYFLIIIIIIVFLF